VLCSACDWKIPAEFETRLTRASSAATLSPKLWIASMKPPALATLGIEKAGLRRSDDLRVDAARGRDLVHEDVVEAIDLGREDRGGLLRERLVRAEVVLARAGEDRRVGVPLLEIALRLVHVERDHADRSHEPGGRYGETLGRARDRVGRGERLLVGARPDGLVLARRDDPLREIEAAVRLAAGRIDLEHDALDRAVLESRGEAALDAVVADEPAHRVQRVAALHEGTHHLDHGDAAFGDRVRLVAARLELDAPSDASGRTKSSARASGFASPMRCARNTCSITEAFSGFTSSGAL
jgi:hypothetical protein